MGCALMGFMLIIFRFFHIKQFSMVFSQHHFQKTLVISDFVLCSFFVVFLINFYLITVFIGVLKMFEFLVFNSKFQVSRTLPRIVFKNFSRFLGLWFFCNCFIVLSVTLIIDRFCPPIGPNWVFIIF